MSKKTKTIALALVCAACLAALVVLGFKGNVIYYYDVAEAIEKADSQQTNRFRLAGAVVVGSISSEGSTTTFDVTDGAKTVTVTHQGDPPELFKDGAPVVCEGSWDKNAIGEKFNSDLIMIRHGNEYTPPSVEEDSVYPGKSGYETEEAK